MVNGALSDLHAHGNVQKISAVGDNVLMFSRAKTWGVNTGTTNYADLNFTGEKGRIPMRGERSSADTDL